jgi:hypothetical protein
MRLTTQYEATKARPVCSSSMTEPDKQDRPATGQFPEHGIPPEAAAAQSKGIPASDRGKTETVAARTEKQNV